MRRTFVGWVLAVTGFLACPCHLIITLPLAAALLGGTALSGWIAGHQGAILVGASLYFIGALAGGATLLLAGTGARTSTIGQPRNACGIQAPRTVEGDRCTSTDVLPGPTSENPVAQADANAAAGIDSRLE